MTTTIILSALLGGIVASHSFLKWGRHSELLTNNLFLLDDKESPFLKPLRLGKSSLDKIEQWCGWAFFP